MNFRRYADFLSAHPKSYGNEHSSAGDSVFQELFMSFKLHNHTLIGVQRVFPFIIAFHYIPVAIMNDFFFQSLPLLR